MKKVDGEATVKMEVPAPSSKRPYQRKVGKNSSGGAEWHSRTDKLRKLGRAIYEWGR